VPAVARHQRRSENSSHRTQLAGEGEFADEFVALEIVPRDTANGGEDADGDGEVEASALD
jgi:hypothetical protein